MNERWTNKYLDIGGLDLVEADNSVFLNRLKMIDSPNIV